MTYLGVDCGTSAVKVVLVDDEGRALASGESAYRPDHPYPLWSEQDPRIWRTAMFAAIAQTRAAAPAAFAETRGVGFSGQMHSAVLLGDDDEPVRPAMLHNDSRAFAEARELWERHASIAAAVGVKPMAGFTAPKLLWLARYEPQTFSTIRTILLPKDYLRLQLTGEKFTDMSDAAGTWWLDEAKRCWSEASLAASGVSPSQVPTLVEGCEPAGALRPDIAQAHGLPKTCIVAAGGGDAAVGAIGLGAIRPGDAYISLGTSSQLILASDAYRAAPEKLVHSFAHALPRRWYRMAAMLNGAGALAFAARLVKAEVADLLREADTDYRGPGALTFLPYLSGERTPLDDPHARGVFFGLSEATSRADLTRSVMEGVALTLADARECLEAAGDSIGDVGLTGGGARSALWARMIAAALNRRILRYRGGASGPAFGAARLARIAATGEAAEAVCTPPAIEDVTEPEPSLVAAFAAKRVRFQALYAALKGEFAAAAAH
jgi:xylulokinase